MPYKLTSSSNGSIGQSLPLVDSARCLAMQQTSSTYLCLRAIQTFVELMKIMQFFGNLINRRAYLRDGKKKEQREKVDIEYSDN